VTEPRPSAVRRARDALGEFTRDEAAGAVVLVAGTLIGLLWANLATAGYHSFWGRELRFSLVGISVHETWAQLVNDGLMVVFFFVVGLEIKRELVTGELRDRRAAALPFFAAIGGMAVPALLFLAVTAGNPALARGWAIPMATDIAFVMGIVALLGRRVPPALRLFLLTLAIVDDIGAIIVIAVFYSDGLAFGWLAGGVALLGLVVVMQRARVNRIWPYAVVAVPFWFCILESGVHATIAGVLLGLATPARPLDGRPVLEELEHWFHPVSAFVVVPIFAVANAGIVLTGGSLSDALTSSLAWGVVVGLLLGKPIGITAGAWLARASKVGRLPDGLGFAQLLGGAIVAGIGFTVSLFVTELSFGPGARADIAKLAILVTSALAAVSGAVVLRLLGRRAASDSGL
jgi:NhaA family Na+:H+ antiporter